MKFWAKFFILLILLSFAAGAAFAHFLPILITRRVESCVARQWLTPLNTGKRTEWDSLLLYRKGAFLAERAAYAHLKSHVHTGIDLQNRSRGGPGEPVYAAAKGKVFDVKVQAQGTRVTIAHLLPNGEVVYTSYIHVAGVRVKKGQRVGPNTVVARRFNRAELKKYGAFYNHLHYQVHKRVFVPEHTINTQTNEEAQKRFYGPEFIFYHHHAEEQADWRSWLRHGKISLAQLVSIIF